MPGTTGPVEQLTQSLGALGESWTIGLELNVPYSSEDWVGHPSASSDGGRLYLATVFADDDNYAEVYAALDQQSIGVDVYQIDSFLNIDGLDLNGIEWDGESAQLGIHPLPAGLDFDFRAELSSDSHSVRLIYHFTNTSESTFSDVQFISFVDIEIQQTRNTFFNEYAEYSGTIGQGYSDPDPDSWEIDEPGFVFGDIYDHLLTGQLATGEKAFLGHSLVGDPQRSGRLTCLLTGGAGNNGSQQDTRSKKKDRGHLTGHGDSSRDRP